MRFVVKHKFEHTNTYVVHLGNRPDEDRYRILHQDVVFTIDKSARFSSAEKHGLTPEEDNKRWFDSFEIGS